MMILNSIESIIDRQFIYYNFEEDLESESIFKNNYDYLSHKKKLPAIEYSYLCWLKYRFGWEVKINVPNIPSIKHIDIISFETQFLFNNHRKLLFKELEKFVKVKKDKNHIEGNVIIGGSFIDAENKIPNDIDVIFLIPNEFLNNGGFNDSEEYATEVFNNVRSHNLDLIFLPLNFNLDKFRAYTYITSYGNKAKISKKNFPSEGIENNTFNEIELIKIVI